MSEGYLFCVGGKDLYYKLLTRAIQTLRQFDPIRPICVLTDDIDQAKSYSQFENIIYKQFQIHNHIVPNINPKNSWHQFGFYPKVFQILYSPFEKTIFFDVDSVFKTDLTFWWDYVDKSQSPFLITGVSDKNNCSPPEWHWGWIYSVMQKSGLCIPQVSSTFMYYDKVFIKTFLKHVQHILLNLENWGCLPYFCDGYPDEIVFALLLAILDMKPDNTMFTWVHNHENLLCCDKNLE
jgi:hypothetical protein